MSETLLATRTAKEMNLALVVSHRSKSPNEVMEADIAFAVGALGLKCGGGANTERLVKYGRIVELMELAKKGVKVTRKLDPDLRIADIARARGADQRRHPDGGRHGDARQRHEIHRRHAAGDLGRNRRGHPPGGQHHRGQPADAEVPATISCTTKKRRRTGSPPTSRRRRWPRRAPNWPSCGCAPSATAARAA